MPVDSGTANQSAKPPFRPIALDVGHLWSSQQGAASPGSTSARPSHHLPAASAQASGRGVGSADGRLATIGVWARLEYIRCLARGTSLIAISHGRVFPPPDGVRCEDGGMSRPQLTYTCSACGAERVGPGTGSAPGGRLPCPNEGCGSVEILIGLTITDGVDVRDLLTANVKDPDLGSRKGRKVDITIGTSYFRHGHRWHHIVRTINYASDRYDETITDKATGDVIRDCHERLSGHRGRGSAKGLSEGP